MRRPGTLVLALLMTIGAALVVDSAPAPAQAAANPEAVTVSVAPAPRTTPYFGEASPYDLVVWDRNGDRVEIDVALTVSGGDLGSPATVTTSEAGPTRVTVVPAAEEVTLTAVARGADGSSGSGDSVTTRVRYRFTTPPSAVVLGSPVVGSVLTAGPAGGVPEPSQTMYLWLVGYTSEPFGGRLAGSGPTYTVRVGDLGQPVRLAVFVQRPYYDAVTVYSVPTTPVRRGATGFDVTSPPTAVAGRRIRVRVSGVATGEAISVYLGRRLVGQTAGKQAGSPEVRFRVPRGLAGRTRTIKVRSAQPDRSGRAKVRILPRQGHPPSPSKVPAPR